MDSPRKLIREAIANLKKNNPDTQAVIMNGDFSAHGTSLKHKEDITEDGIQEAWTKMKRLMSKSLGDVRKEFPGIAVLPTIGNNDVVIHNKVPCPGDPFEK